MRNPWIDPRDGDVLHQADGAREVLVDNVSNAHVTYRLTDGHGGLIGAF
jgi:hypothetical protein